MTEIPTTPFSSEPAWVEHAVLWQLYPLGAVGAPQSAEPGKAGRVVHRLPRLAGWFDYAVELGASGIQLGPIFASETHGYDTVDYYRIDPRLGDDADFAALVESAHARGLKLVLDGVFNHVGRAFPRFADALAGGDASLFRPRPDGAGFENFEGHDSLVLLNHDTPAVADLVADVMIHWLDRGADGWRLDAAYAVPPEFWRRVLPRVRERHPDVFVVGEVIQGDYVEIVDRSSLDSVTQYELWKAIRSSIEEANFYELDHALGRHDEFVRHFAPLTFVGNHDVTRIASAIEDARHLSHALVALLTAGGTPSLYYGDEQGFRGVKEERFGGDDAIRPELPEGGASALAAEGWPLYRLHQELIGLRRRHPWLHRATHRSLHLTNTEYLYSLTANTDADADVDTGAEATPRIVVALNIGDAPIDIEVPDVSTVLAGAATLKDGGIQVRPHSWAVVG